MSPNLQAFLTMIGLSEGTEELGDHGYNVLVGGTLFTSFADHPRVLVDLGNGLKSTAAGRYQILERMFDAYKVMLHLPDFGPASQDAIAVQMIHECHATADVEAGNFDDAVASCASRWASLPGANYGQRENQLADLRRAFTQAGGTLA
jgi:muramidase (phage lysozyme)